MILTNFSVFQFWVETIPATPFIDEEGAQRKQRPNSQAYPVHLPSLGDGTVQRKRWGIRRSEPVGDLIAKQPAQDTVIQDYRILLVRSHRLQEHRCPALANESAIGQHRPTGLGKVAISVHIEASHPADQRGPGHFQQMAAC